MSKKLAELTEDELMQVTGGLLKPEGNAALMHSIGGAAVIALIAAVAIKKKTAAGAEERQ